MNMRSMLVLGGACALAGCSSPEDEAVTPAPEPVLTGNPVTTEASDGSAMTAGEWVIGEDANGAHARFGPTNSEPLLALECDSASQVLTLARASDAISEQAYVLEAGGMKASVDMEPAGGDLPMQTAEINRAMPIFRAFAQPGAVITMSGPGGARLLVPGAPGIARVLEACSRA